MTKKILLGANYSIIEPLGLLHLSTIAKQEGFDPKIILIKDGNFEEMEYERQKTNPEYIGMQLFTGNHLDTFKYFEKIKGSDTKTIFGGPHATYFPKESSKYADYVVVSEGFNSFRRILNNKADKGIVVIEKKESFPPADRESFYKNYKEHKKNPIKSIITKTGCPYSCTYCYNSSKLSTLEKELDKNSYEKMEKILGKKGRLFVDSQRSVQEILFELESIKKLSPNTKMIYFQDDVFGTDLNWLREFVKKYDKSFKYHAQLRFEYANPKTDSGKERLNLLKSSGCTGLTFAIEAANPVVRKEVLNRNINNKLMFESLSYINELGFKVRTEQMLGLPLGATKEKTKINLDADLETLELNVKLKEATNLPNLAWTSIFTPYEGTKLAKYCSLHGFFDSKIDLIPSSFFEKSLLNFPKEWVGQNLKPNNKEQWMSYEEQRKYKEDLICLKDYFSIFAQIPRGHELARDFLNQQDKSSKKLGEMLKKHIFDKIIYETD